MTFEEKSFSAQNTRIAIVICTQPNKTFDDDDAYEDETAL
jgi:hypothetical protein